MHAVLHAEISMKETVKEKKKKKCKVWRKKMPKPNMWVLGLKVDRSLVTKLSFVKDYLGSEFWNHKRKDDYSFHIVLEKIIAKQLQEKLCNHCNHTGVTAIKHGYESIHNSLI